MRVPDGSPAPKNVSDNPAHHDKPSSKGQIRSHTGLRGIAALLVVAYHQQFGATYRFSFEVTTEVFRRCYLMVDLFFVLSGFIISYVYVADRPRPFSFVEIREFLMSRFARIYPLHLFSLIYLGLFVVGTTWVLSILGDVHDQLTGRDFWDWTVQLILLNSWVHTQNEWNAPSWSISAEIFAYVLFPVLAALNARGANVFRLPLLMLPFAFYSFVAGTTGSLDITVGAAPLRCLAGFALGMLLYLERARASRISDAMLSGYQLLGTAWVFLALMFKVVDPLIIPAFLLLVWATWQDRGLVAVALSAKPFQWLGEISYSVYLLHVPLGLTLWFAWSRIDHHLGLTPPVSRAIWLFINFSVVLAVSTVTYRLIETPARRSLLKLFVRRRPPPGDIAVAAP